ncbi:hypothetical protein [Candidatus Viridilinea mediisalina]|uniref:Uncharacterized protein n=1 Tax=Candidatus Viridilinea mediisalina TaxID=2024553 RepID=A0A2A6RPW7_9CHLR|nr:hypothetical protein [Candidatus Viridilinea mediisalina]PDW04919.1 hypothetical protein CJ255_00645 [Candidatus Viridilinea mediisalina]
MQQQIEGFPVIGYRLSAIGFGAEELALLERNARLVQRLAVVLDQDEQLLEAIGQGSVHPAMSVFGLWRDDPAMDDLAERLADQRTDQPSRAVPEL